MKVTVVTPHRSNYPNPISFNAGETVIAVAEDPQHPGWIRVRTSDGNEGWAPMAYLEDEPDGLSIAVKDYLARELDTVPKEVLTVHFEHEGWLWVSNDSGGSGWVPKATVVST